MPIRPTLALLALITTGACVPASAPRSDSSTIAPSCRGALSQSALTAIRVANQSADGPNDLIAPQC